MTWNVSNELFSLNCILLQCIYDRNDQDRSALMWKNEKRIWKGIREKPVRDDSVAYKD